MLYQKMLTKLIIGQSMCYDNYQFLCLVYKTKILRYIWDLQRNN